MKDHIYLSNNKFYLNFIFSVPNVAWSLAKEVKRFHQPSQDLGEHNCIHRHIEEPHNVNTSTASMDSS